MSIALKAKSTLDDEPEFPPLLNGRPVDAGDIAFDEAVRACVNNTAGAGDFFWSRSEAMLDVAIVLEPEISAAQAVQMLFVAMVAFGDSFGAIGPPEVGVFYQWPNGMLINGARFGEARVGLPPGGASDVPGWMVVAINARIQPDMAVAESGRDLLNTSLWDEGAGDLDRTMLVESFARHLLTAIHNWGEDGFKAAHENWLSRAIGHKELIDLKWQGKRHKGTFLSIDEGGNLLLKRKAETVVLPVSAIVERPE